MVELWKLSLAEMHGLLKEKSISSVELTQSYLERINSIDSEIKSYITVCGDFALKQAGEADRRIAKGECEKLTGIPVQIKDLIATKDIRTTCGSNMLADYVPVFNATCVERLYEAGAVLLGKGNMDEFGMGSSCENSAFYATNNPWDKNRIPGGSSGGAAAAVASGQAPYAIGSDTGGSIRQPAAMCGIVGLKPTYGLVSRYGLVAYASSFDQIGPMGKNVEDCAAVLEVISGYDELDSTSLQRPTPSYSDCLDANIAGVRLGIPEEYFSDGMENGVRERVISAVEKLKSMGAIIVPVSLPTTKYALACYYILAPSECSANLARYDGVKYGYSYQDTEDMWEAMGVTRSQGFGMEVKRRIMLGTYALSSGYYDAFYLKAQKVRTLIRNDFDAVFQTVDALVAPTSPVVAFEHGDRTDDPVRMYSIDVCTLPVNIAGLPAVSLPCGLSDGLPVGLQIIGPHFSEGNILNIAYAYERDTEWSGAIPVID
ncbi:MAG: Asp-tRNA(Asn)/Glu-tRNA(Gln) amidotransferase GatCAB subunit A [Dehalococcoidia bacterium]|nr:Asp-tRNA(Asn)/Glu-tRNA(Gln) amidotransferase GatCAB subunit A [Dehalococcoidia bacterium]